MWFIRVVSFGAAIALAGVLAAISLSVRNHALEQEVSERQQMINQGLALSQVHTKLVNTLALLAERNNDDQIRRLLADQGIRLNATQTRSEQSQKPTQRR